MSQHITTLLVICETDPYDSERSYFMAYIVTSERVTTHAVDMSYRFDCRPDVWPRLPTAAPLGADKFEAEGKMDGTT